MVDGFVQQMGQTQEADDVGGGQLLVRCARQADLQLLAQRSRGDALARPLLDLGDEMVAMLGAQLRGGLSPKRDGAAARAHGVPMKRQMAQQRRLPRSGEAGDDEEVPVGDAQTDIRKDRAFSDGIGFRADARAARRGEREREMLYARAHAHRRSPPSSRYGEAVRTAVAA